MRRCWFLALCLMAITRFSHAQLVDQSLSGLGKTSSRMWIELSTNTGHKPDDILKIKNAFPGYHLLSQCTGSFANEGYTEFALGLINEKEGKGVYAAVLNDPAKNDYRVVRLTTFAVAFNEKGWPENYMEVQCNSAMLIKRINRNLSKQRNEAGQPLGSLRALSNYDSICVSPFDKPHLEFVCYGYDFQKNGFVEIGGWSTP